MPSKSSARSFAVLIAASLAAAVLVSGCATRSSYSRFDQSLRADIRSIDGSQYLPLSKVCEAYGLDCEWDPVVKTATLTRQSDRIVVRAGSDRILYNGTTRRIARPVVLSGGAAYMPASFIRSELASMPRGAAAAPVIPPPASMEQKKFTIRTIVLDTGHGGKDAGAIGPAYGTKEKDLALKLSNKVKSILENNGIRVIMTRSDDTFITLQRRAQIANSSGADLFVSIHINASRSRSLKGFECYYLSSATDDNARALEAFENESLELGDAAAAERSQQLDKTLWDMALSENRMESGELAGFICAAVAESSLAIRSRGVKTARFYVLKHSNIPAVLVEAGYISNRFEELQLKDSRVLNGIAEAIARGILRYKDRYEKTAGFTDVRP